MTISGMFLFHPAQDFRVKVPMLQLLLATHNQAKIREYHELLAVLPYNLVTLSEAGITLKVPETGSTFEENAVVKATAYVDQGTGESREAFGHVLFKRDSANSTARSIRGSAIPICDSCGPRKTTNWVELLCVEK